MLSYVPIVFIKEAFTSAEQTTGISDKKSLDTATSLVGPKGEPVHGTARINPGNFSDLEQNFSPTCQEQRICCLNENSHLWI